MLFCLFMIFILIKSKCNFQIYIMTVKKSSLPPGLDEHSSYVFGDLSLKFLNLNQLSFIKWCKPLFLGCSDSQYLSVNDSISYNVKTNYWHFYSYLSDMNGLYFQFLDHKNEKYFGRMDFSLKIPSQVLNPDAALQNNLSLFARNSPQYTQKFILYKQSGQKTIHQIQAKIGIQFQKNLHELIKDVIDFSELLVINGISPITSENELPRQPPSKSLLFEGTFQPKLPFKQQNKKDKSKKKNKSNKKFDSQSKQSIQVSETETKQKKMKKQRYQDELELLKRNYLQVMGQSESSHKLSTVHNLTSSPEPKQQDIARMMEEDIDRLISEMQSKPYDCSRYQSDQNQGNIDKKRSSSQNKMLNSTGIYVASSTLTETHLANNNYSSATNFYQSNEKKTFPNKPPLPRQNQLHSRQKSHSKKQMSTRKYNQSYNEQNSLHRTNSTHSLPQKALKNSQKSEIVIKINELLISSIDEMEGYSGKQQIFQQNYSVRVYINNQPEEYFSAQGIPEGENIIYNQTLRLRNINHIHMLKFVLIDEYGNGFFIGTFNISRLEAASNFKGMFMIPMTPISHQNFSETLRVKESKISHVPKIIYRTLRIEAELIQKLQMIQIYLKVSQFDVKHGICRYKIPFSKENIQFNGNFHENIFPHSINPNLRQQRIIIEIWNRQGNNIIGQADISLKNIQNYNIHAVNASLQPIYLYDCRKQIRDPFNNNQIIGRFSLQVCFGNVRQTQGMLAKIKTLQAKKVSQKVQVTKEDRLGVYIKQKKCVAQVEVQADIDLYQENKKERQISFQGAFQSRISHQSHPSMTSQNQFIDWEQKIGNSPNKINESSQKIKFNNIKKSHSFNNSKINKQKQQKNNSVLKLPTITESLAKSINTLLEPIKNVLQIIKQKSKPYLLYNFIEIGKLVQILQNEGLSNDLISKIFQQILLPSSTASADSNMININLLYDFCIDLELDGSVKEALISDNLLIQWAFRILYKEQKQQSSLLLTNNMEYIQMKQMFERVKIKITMREYNIIDKFMNKFKSKEQSIGFKQKIINRLNEEIKQEIRKGMYEEDILKQIYNSQVSNYSLSQDRINLQSQSLQVYEEQTSQVEAHNNTSYEQKDSLKELQAHQAAQNIENYSFGYSPEKKDETKQKKIIQNFLDNPLKIKENNDKLFENKLQIKGILNIQQSAELLLDYSMKNSYLRIRIQSPTFEQITLHDNNLEQHRLNNEDFIILLGNSMHLEDVDGLIQLCLDGLAIACARFSLIRGVKSVYPMKTKSSEFCGLLNLLLH